MKNSSENVGILDFGSKLIAILIVSLGLRVTLPLGENVTYLGKSALTERAKEIVADFLLRLTIGTVTTELWPTLMPPKLMACCSSLTSSTIKT
jgi:hypothetical protein